MNPYSLGAAQHHYIGRRKMRITALVENTRPDSRRNLRAEHGLSLHVHREDIQILFDTGATEAFSDNAEKLGVNIQEVDMVVISHHHYDHGGGLAHFLDANQQAKVFLRQCEEREFYFRAFGIINKSVGLDWELLQRYADRLECVDEFTEIAPEVFILTKIEKPYPLPKGNRYLFAKTGNGSEPDTFEHELIMVIREQQGLVVFTGCSHSGILNMIETVAKRFPGVRIKAVLGGFHLVGLPILNTMAGRKSELEDMGRQILEYPIDKLYTGHCTGMKAYRILKGVLGERLEYLPTGMSVEV
jgi:7,8-dihydropterin-6-yl-methyl-4-(beta-D-ribofuranosyl)aminobenzene 5'-phosphate synthase